ncbi:unnamed protein product [Amoebophrya sp. A120]|nr:unnamed protein product [Amoebophrya sp. A120]|eukprot:GSA120T00018826001.1
MVSSGGNSSSSSSHSSATTALLGFATLALAAASVSYWQARKQRRRRRAKGEDEDGERTEDEENSEFALLPSLRNRRSVFPKDYVQGGKPAEPRVVESLLQAAMWAPYHGPVPPWRFVVLGKDAMVEMQRLTLAFYDQNWREAGFPGANKVPAGQERTEADYEKWREMTEGEISRRWGPVSYMIAIVMRRQASPKKRMQEWEEAAATACAVQNMHVQATKFPSLACYWSSWHGAARDSAEMAKFLGMEDPEDKCFGFFMVASCREQLPDRRRRKPATHLAAEWRV